MMIDVVLMLLTTRPTLVVSPNNMHQYLNTPHTCDCGHPSPEQVECHREEKGDAKAQHHNCGPGCGCKLFLPRHDGDEIGVLKHDVLRWSTQGGVHRWSKDVAGLAMEDLHLSNQMDWQRLAVIVT